jgi:acetate kinase
VQVVKLADSHILTINSGSSSIKFALFKEDQSLPCVLHGRIECIGLPQTTFHVKGAIKEDNFSRLVVAPDHSSATDILLGWIEKQGLGETLVAIGHRVVHGGPKYNRAERITIEMISDLRKLFLLDPEHLPSEILIVEGFQRKFPNVPQVACFDTAFHHGMPRVAQLLPIPRRFEAFGIRRYGFHGLSYAYLMEELTSMKAANGRIILAHLGNGASLAAVRDNKSMDTSMSFTPASGVLMSTRSGDIDPGLSWYLARLKKFDAKQFNEMINFHSGLLGVSETSSDMHDLLDLEYKDIRAAEAVSLFCYQIKKCIGSFAAVLGGLDTLVFSGGIGENAPKVRAKICDGLEFLGIELEEKQNVANGNLISGEKSRVTVRMIRTDEEKMIARSVREVLDRNENLTKQKDGDYVDQIKNIDGF